MMETLEWYEHIRRRPEMYLGRLEDGVYTMLRAVYDYLKFFCGRIEGKTSPADAEIRTYDHVIPIERLIAAFSGLPAGMGDVLTVDNNAGLKAANALSESFYLASYRDSVCSWARFSGGVLVEQGRQATSESDGVCVRFTPDRTIFSDHPFDPDKVEDVFKSI